MSQALTGTAPFVLIGVVFGIIVIVANCMLIARGRPVRRSAFYGTVAVTLALSTMLVKGGN